MRKTRNRKEFELSERKYNLLWITGLQVLSLLGQQRTRIMLFIFDNDEIETKLFDKPEMLTNLCWSLC